MQKKKKKKQQKHTRCETAARELRINRRLSFAGVDANIVIVRVIFIVIVLATHTTVSVHYSGKTPLWGVSVL